MKSTNNDSVSKFSSFLKDGSKKEVEENEEAKFPPVERTKKSSNLPKSGGATKVPQATPAGEWPQTYSESLNQPMTMKKATSAAATLGPMMQNFTTEAQPCSEMQPLSEVNLDFLGYNIYKIR